MKELQVQRRPSGPLSRLGEVEETSETEVTALDDNSNPSSSGTTTSNFTSRLPVIMERRSSVVKKQTGSFNEGGTGSFNEGSQDISAQRRSSVASSNTTLLAARRASIPQGSSPTLNLAMRRGSKPLFASIGRRVSSLVRARLAFRRRPSKSSSSPDSEPENPMEVIYELPRNPRFSSFLSPEAQYAMMKGYEDKLYEDLAGSYPESAGSLKRNKTPAHRQISIRGTSASKPSAKSEAIDEEDDEDATSSSSSTPSSPSHNSATPAATRASTFYITAPSPNPSHMGKSSDRGSSPMSTSTPSPHPQSPTPSPFLKPIGRRGTIHDVNRNQISSPSSLASYPMTSHSMTSSMTHMMTTPQCPLQRSNSLPVLAGAGLPYDRRLVLSYRLESAMDILDTVRQRKGEYSLSPRVVKNSRPIAPVSDFNSWTSVWGKEFKEVPVN